MRQGEPTNKQHRARKQEGCNKSSQETMTIIVYKIRTEKKEAAL